MPLGTAVSTKLGWGEGLSAATERGRAGREGGGGGEGCSAGRAAAPLCPCIAM